MEKYQFKQEEGVTYLTKEQSIELCNIAKEQGYTLSVSPGNEYWFCHEDVGHNMLWSTSLGYFYNSTNTPKVKRTFEEMKQLLTQHLRKEFPKDWVIYGSEEFAKLVKENVWFFGTDCQIWTLTNGYPYRYGMCAGEKDLDYYSDIRPITNTLVTIEQLTDYVNSINPNKNKQVMKNEDEIVRIPMEFLAEGMVAMSTEQRAKFLPNINVVNGEVTVRAVRDCYKNVCSEWKTKFEKLFPWLVGKEELIIYGQKFHGKELFGEPSSKAMIQPRGFGKYVNKAFYLSDGFNWRIEVDINGSSVLIPTKK